jgi:hypothetical protein
MEWFSTELKRDGRSRLVHSYFCRTCTTTAQIEEPWKAKLRIVSWR